MKTLSKILLISSLFVFLVSGCTKDFEKINTNPNNPTSIESGYILTYTQKNFIDNLRNEWFAGRGTQLFAQQWSQNNYPDEDRYAIRSTTLDNAWRSFYRTIMNLEQIIKLNTDPATKGNALASGPNEHQIAVAKIMKAWIFQIITDTWGDVPYSEAFKANLNRSPKYDKQSDIYADLINELIDAAALIDPANGDISGDLIYGGDMAKWKKFANTLRLRIALRMSNVDNAPLTAVLALPATSFFESNADNAGVTYLQDSPNEGPVYVAFFVNSRNDFTITKTFCDLLKGVNDTLNAKTNPFVGIFDPRLPLWAYPVDGTNYYGMPFGMDDAHTKAYAPNTPSYYDHPSVVHAPDFTYLYMDYAEYCFIMSEVNGWNQTWYTKGIQASMEWWGVDAADITAYLAAVPAANQENVLTQKYIALYMQPEQAWAEYRRTGYPHTLLHPGEITMKVGATNVIFETLNVDDTDIPRRMTYPQDEYNVNKANVEAAAALLGADKQTSNVWWEDVP